MIFLRNNSKGITLVALVITIIILVILAGIVILALLNNDIANQAKSTTSIAKSANIKEQAEVIKSGLILSKRQKQETLTSSDLAEKIRTTDYFYGSSIYKYSNGNIVVTTSDNLYDIVIKEDLTIEVLEHASLLQGTWLFNDTITYSNDLYFEFDGVFHNSQYSFPIYSIQCNENFGYHCFFPWYWINNNSYHPNSFAYLPENTIGFISGWVWLNVNTYEHTKTTGVKVTINSDISEVTDAYGNPAGEQLLNWLQANATKQ